MTGKEFDATLPPTYFPQSKFVGTVSFGMDLMSSCVYKSPLTKKGSKSQVCGTIARTLTPTVTGTSVVGLLFNGGVIVAADTLGSYGSLARFRSLSRVKIVNDKTMLAVGGDFADFQNLSEELDNLVTQSDCTENGDLSARSIYGWISSVLYYHRSQFNPLLLNVLIAGIDQRGKPFLGSVNDRGTAYEESVIARGLGSYLIMPWIRQQIDESALPSREEAIELIKRAMTLLFYRDCRSFARYQYGIMSQQESGEIQSEVNEGVVESKWEMMDYEKLPVL
ncbi:hypothetical protein ACOME3_002503 [Neoechinorhynchus agilis]